MSATLLVVDDDSQLRSLARAILEPEGFRIIEAGTVEMARRLIALERVDLALLDLGLPDASGIDLLPVLRAAHPEARAIIISATGTIGSALNAMNAGAQDFLRKPFRPDALVTAARNALDSSRKMNPISAVRREFTRTNINGHSFELMSAVRDDAHGDVTCTFAITSPSSETPFEFRVVLPNYVQELAKALLDCDRFPCGDRFWPRLAEEELALTLWSGNPLPESGAVRIEAISDAQKAWLRSMTTAPVRCELHEENPLSAGNR
ncbi:MAG: hypothetical protein C4320_05515 [Armatimonadota bacterium]